MSKRTILSAVLIISFALNVGAQKRISQSNLPIILIDAPTILSEPKVTASMGIIYNGSDKLNTITDDWNEYNGQIGIELRGQSSLSLFPKKSYGLETRDSIGNNLNISLIGMPKENDWVLYGPYSDKSLMRNALAYIIAGRTMEYAPRVRFVELIINDNYQGIYLLTEKIKRDKNRVNIQTLDATSEDITGGYIIKFDKGNEIGWTSPYPSIRNFSPQARFLYHYPKKQNITTAQKDYIKEYITAFEDVLQSNDFADPVNGYGKYIDAASFQNFLIVNEISKNVDGYRLSTFMYKDSDTKDGRLKKGPVWDFNLAFGNADYCDGGTISDWAYNFNDKCPNDFWVIHFWWKRLLQDENFRTSLTERWETLRQSTLSNEAILGIVDSLEQLLIQEKAVTRNFQEWDVLEQYIWPNAFVGNNYQAEVNYLRNWLNRRLGWLDNQFKDLKDPFEPPTQVALGIKVFPNPSKGDVQFEFSVNRVTRSEIQIFNAIGQLVHQQTIIDDNFSQQYQYTWQPTAKGVYYYKINTEREGFYQGAFIVVE